MKNQYQNKYNHQFNHNKNNNCTINVTTNNNTNTEFDQLGIQFDKLDIQKNGSIPNWQDIWMISVAYQKSQKSKKEHQQTQQQKTFKQGLPDLE